MKEAKNLTEAQIEARAHQWNAYNKAAVSKVWGAAGAGAFAGLLGVGGPGLLVGAIVGFFVAQFMTGFAIDRGISKRWGVNVSEAKSAVELMNYRRRIELSGKREVKWTQ